MIRFIPPALKKMEQHAVADFPDECCGFLFGNEDAEGNRIISVLQEVKNAKQGDKRRRFEITPKDYMKAEIFSIENSLSLLGIYHSHPNHPAIPSEHDRVAAQPFFSYVIVSVMDGKIDHIRSWKLNESVIFEEESISNSQINHLYKDGYRYYSDSTTQIHNQTAKLQVEAGTVGEIIKAITNDYPDLRKHLLDEQGAVRSFVNIFVGDEDIRDLQSEKTLVSSSTIVSIVPAIAGGNL